MTKADKRQTQKTSHTDIRRWSIVDAQISELQPTMQTVVEILNEVEFTPNENLYKQICHNLMLIDFAMCNIKKEIERIDSNNREKANDSFDFPVNIGGNRRLPRSHWW